MAQHFSIRVASATVLVAFGSTLIYIASGRMWADDSPPKISTGPLEVNPHDFSAADEARYLFFALGRLQSQLDMALRAGNDAAVKGILVRAKAVANHCKKKALTPDIGALYGSIFESSDDYAAVIRKLNKEWYDRQRKLDALGLAQQQRRLMREAEDVRGAVNAVAGGEAVAAQMFGYRPIRSSEAALGWFRLSSAIGQLTTQHEMIDAAAYQAAKKDLTSEADAAVVVLVKQYEAAREKRRQEYVKFGEMHFGLEDPNGDYDLDRISSVLLERKDKEALLAIIAAWAKHERGNTGHDNPFRVVELETCRAFIPTLSDAKRITLIAEAARAVVEAAKHIPRGPLYDPDRAYVLLHAAMLSNLAAELETKGKTLLGEKPGSPPRFVPLGAKPEPEGFRSTSRPHALYALQIVDAIANTEYIDITGEVREQRVYGLARSGSLDAAEEQILKLGEQQSDNPYFMFFTAQVAGARKNANEARNRIRTAIRKTGFNRFDLIRGTHELVPAVLTDEELDNLIECQGTANVQKWQANIEADPKLNTATIEYVGPVDITSVIITIQSKQSGIYAPPDANKKEFRFQVLKPGMKIILEGIDKPIPVPVVNTRTVTATITCDQLKKRLVQNLKTMEQ